MSPARLNLVPPKIQEEGWCNVAPEFWLEISSSAFGMNNELLYQRLNKAGVETGILFDHRDGGMIYLFCQTNLLTAFWEQTKAQIAANQIEPIQQQIDELHQLFLQSEDNLVTMSRLFRHRAQLQPGWQHEPFPNVSCLEVPLSLVEGAAHGPNIIVHCVGAANGLRLDLSEVPLT
ncbi:hypothetical protein SAMD00019534_020760 [Acytostelium subglobosum LB1]|uniref:hypothetical protein n=1 Tax=Acytostelium subglobosum LB1 TaxID=1410327 RepID=UPI0006447C0A|nr:hypothetical protein SAMD00019534_020760 [Acytostelium subglobosum LB1]GAM18901.1 hypothetical protein SAMD00019534_020760 [Acytostelium subglobosum LB1]|eukprot:XP_012758121.1 hypothetical protein SAMD00019534_020760 [Acytostelium subglobosum LB1]